MHGLVCSGGLAVSERRRPMLCALPMGRAARNASHCLSLPLIPSNTSLTFHDRFMLSHSWAVMLL